MRNKPTFIAVAALVVTFAAALMLSSASLAKDKEKTAKQGDEFRATIVDMNAPAGQMAATAWIKINAYTTDAQVESYLQTLSQKGQMELFNQTSKLDIGYFRIGGSLGYPIAVARTRQTDTGRTVLILLNKPMQGVQMTQGVNAADFPFSLVELTLDAKGKGTGQIIGAAQVAITPDHKVTIAGSGAIPTRLMDVTTK
jgi:sulfate adenylyltransferase subunit 1 (EFTu-like GTPase family)